MSNIKRIALSTTITHLFILWSCLSAALDDLVFVLQLQNLKHVRHVEPLLVHHQKVADIAQPLTRALHPVGVVHLGALGLVPQPVHDKVVAGDEPESAVLAHSAQDGLHRVRLVAYLVKRKLLAQLERLFGFYAGGALVLAELGLPQPGETVRTRRVVVRGDAHRALLGWTAGGDELAGFAFEAHDVVPVIALEDHSLLLQFLLVGTEFHVLDEAVLVVMDLLDVSEEFCPEFSTEHAHVHLLFGPVA